MAQTLSKSNIVDGNTIEPIDVYQTVDALTGAVDYDLSISGSLTMTGSIQNDGIVTVSNSESPYTILDTDYTVLVNANGGNVTINLPTASGNKGRQIFFKVTTDPGSNVITIQRQGSDTIDGGSETTQLNTQYDALSCISDGTTRWYIF